MLNSKEYNPENLESEKKVGPFFPKKEMDKRLTPENVTEQKFKYLNEARREVYRALDKKDRLEIKRDNILATTRNKKKAKEKILKEITPLMEKATEEYNKAWEESDKAHNEWWNAEKEELEARNKKDEEDDKENE